MIVEYHVKTDGSRWAKLDSGEIVPAEEAGAVSEPDSDLSDEEE